MVEVLEYALVFGVVSLLAGFSLVVVQGALPVLHESQGSAEFDELSGGAASAALGGNATVVMPLSDASIGCTEGHLTFSSGGLNFSSTFGYPCNFSYSGISGVCQLFFSRSSGVVELRVES